ncbi:DedA family protein [Desulfonauticus submarinus]
MLVVVLVAAVAEVGNLFQIKMENFLILIINQLKYIGIFFGAFIEGPITGFLAGVLVRKNIICFFGAYLAHLLGDFSADLIYYFSGYFSSRVFFKKLSKFLKISLNDIERVKNKFLEHPKKIIIFGKLTHFLGLPVLISAGLSKYSWKKFLFLNLVATALKSFILISLGWYFMDQWEKAKSIFSYLNLIGAAILILLGSYLLLKYIRKKYA